MTATDRWPKSHGEALAGPGTGFVAIVQSDTAELSHVVRWIRFRAAGTVTAIGVDGSNSGEQTVTDGEIWPCQIKQIMETGTSLTNAQMLGFK